MVQPSLITVCANPSVIRPKNKKQWQLFRNTAIAGSGAYFAMDKNGVIEPIGSGGGSTPFSTRIDRTVVLGDSIFSAVNFGGVAPFTYLWDYNGTSIGTGNTNNGTFVTPNAISTSLSIPNFNLGSINSIRVTVTDALGSKSFGYYMYYSESF